MQAYGFVGAPLTAALVAWLQLGMLLAVCRAGGHHRKCWGGWTAEAWRGLGPMCKLGAAGMVRLPSGAAIGCRSVGMYLSIWHPHCR